MDRENRIHARTLPSKWFFEYKNQKTNTTPAVNRKHFRNNQLMAIIPYMLVPDKELAMLFIFSSLLALLCTPDDMSLVFVFQFGSGEYEEIRGRATKELTVL